MKMLSRLKNEWIKKIMLTLFSINDSNKTLTDKKITALFSKWMHTWPLKTSDIYSNVIWVVSLSSKHCTLGGTLHFLLKWRQMNLYVRMYIWVETIDMKLPEDNRRKKKGIFFFLFQNVYDWSIIFYWQSVKFWRNCLL